MGVGFFQEFEAFCSVTGAEPNPWEINMVRELYLLHNRYKNQPKNKTAATTGPQVAGLMRGLSATRSTHKKK